MSIIDNNWIYKQSTTGINKDVETIITGDTDSNYVEVVRCKDCIHWLKDNKPSNKPEYRLCEYYRGYKNQDGFCDFGERKK